MIAGLPNCLREDTIVRITVGKERGSGVVVHNEPVTLLTAYHVLTAAKQAGTDAYYSPEIEASIFPGRRVLRGALDDNTVVALPEEDVCLVRLAASDPAITCAAAYRAPQLNPSLAWWAYGFPDDAPKQGLPLTGTVTARDTLFADQAAAGRGLSVAGLSGAGCFFGETVCGVIAESLGAAGPRGAILNLGGTLFFRSIEQLRSKSPASWLWWGPDPVTLVDQCYPAQREVLVEWLAPGDPAEQRRLRGRETRPEALAGWLSRNSLARLYKMFQRVGAIEA